MSFLTYCIPIAFLVVPRIYCCADRLYIPLVVIVGPVASLPFAGGIHAEIINDVGVSAGFVIFPFGTGAAFPVALSVVGFQVPCVLGLQRLLAGVVKCFDGLGNTFLFAVFPHPCSLSGFLVTLVIVLDKLEHVSVLVSNNSSIIGAISLHGFPDGLFRLVSGLHAVTYHQLTQMKGQRKNMIQHKCILSFDYCIKSTNERSRFLRPHNFISERENTKKNQCDKK